MKRIEELKNFLNQNSDNLVLTENLINELIFIENQLDELKKLPFISVNPKNPLQQKATPAAKQYKELLQQYINCLKPLMKITDSDSDEDSPLRNWIKNRTS